MHWAAHKHTAAEVIYQRADADKDNMGLTAWAGKEIKRSDVEIAKELFKRKEIDALNKIVTAYLDIAEVHALNQEPMYMKDWLETIDDYLKMTRRDILTTKGRVTHKQALERRMESTRNIGKSRRISFLRWNAIFFESIEELQELDCENVTWQDGKGKFVYWKWSIPPSKTKSSGGISFSGYKDIPVSYQSVANQLPSVFAIHFKALDSNLPDYVVPFIFVYSPTFFYVFYMHKTICPKGLERI